MKFLLSILLIIGSLSLSILSMSQTSLAGSVDPADPKILDSSNLANRCLKSDMYNEADGKCYCPDGSIDLYRQGCLSDNMPTTDFNTEKVIKLGQSILIFLSIIVMIYGGINYTNALGDEWKINKAKKTIIYGIVAIVFAVIAPKITSFIINFF